MKRRNFVCCLTSVIFLFGSLVSCGSASISDLTDETYLSKFEEITEEEALLIIGTYDYQTAYTNITRLKGEYYYLDSDSSYGEIKANVAKDTNESSLYFYLEPTSRYGNYSYYVLINGSNNSYTMYERPRNSPTVSTTSLTFEEAKSYVNSYDLSSFIYYYEATSIASNENVVSYSKYSNLLRIDVWTNYTTTVVPRTVYSFYVFDDVGRLRHFQADTQYNTTSSRAIRTYTSIEYNIDLGSRLTTLF